MPDSITWMVDSEIARSAIDYTIRLLSSLLGRHARIVRSGDTEESPSHSIWYSASPPRGSGIWIVPEREFWIAAREARHLPPVDLRYWESVIVPVWAPEEPALAPSESVKRLPTDPIAATFFLVSRMEEIDPPKLDALGRFCAEDAWIVRAGLVDRPLVNEYAQLLGAALGVATPSLPWPGGHSMGIAMSHDIDRLRMHGSLRELWQRAKSALKHPEERPAMRRRLQSAWKVMRGGSDPFDTFEEIIRLHRAHEFSATFFWIATRPNERDADYHAQQLKVESTLALLRDDGFEIGLHGSHDSPADSGRLTFERESLEQATRTAVRTTRQHLLRFRLGQTWEAQAGAGLRVDSTIGFAEQMGFRAGIAAPFRPWSFARNEPLDIWEVPMVMMDVTAREYMLLSPDEARDHSRRLLERIANCHGGAAILWHNSSLNEVDWAGWAPVYDSWLEDTKRLGGWGTSVGALADCWAGHVRRLGNDG